MNPKNEYKIKDYIDERNKKEKIASSIIKRKNINYTPIEELERLKELAKEEEQDKSKHLDYAASILQEQKDNSQVNKALRQMEHELSVSQEEIEELLKERN